MREISEIIREHSVAVALQLYSGIFLYTSHCVLNVNRRRTKGMSSTQLHSHDSIPNVHTKKNISKYFKLWPFFRFLTSLV